MSCIISRTGFLTPWKASIIPIRTRRVNVQKPRPPFYTRALYEALTKPYYEPREVIKLPPSMTCLKKREKEEDAYRPDNPYEKIIAKEALVWFKKSKLIGIVHTNPLAVQDKIEADLKLKRERLNFRVYSHHTLRIALKDTIYEPAMVLFKTHTGIIFGENSSQAEKLIKILKKIPQFVLLAAIVEERFLSMSQLKAFSSLKTIEDARCAFVATLDSTRAAPSALLNQHQTTLVAMLQQHADTNLKS